MGKKEIASVIEELEFEVKKFRKSLRSLDVGMSNVQIYGGTIDHLKIGSQAAEVEIYAKNDDGPAWLLYSWRENQTPNLSFR